MQTNLDQSKVLLPLQEILAKMGIKPVGQHCLIRTYVRIPNYTPSIIEIKEDKRIIYRKDDIYELSNNPDLWQFMYYSDDGVLMGLRGKSGDCYFDIVEYVSAYSIVDLRNKMPKVIRESTPPYEILWQVNYSGMVNRYDWVKMIPYRECIVDFDASDFAQCITDMYKWLFNKNLLEKDVK